MWFGLKHEVPAILDAGGGAIVNVDSTAGIQASSGRTPYGANRYGVVGFTRAVALEYAAEDLRISAVYPIIVETAAL